MKVKEKAAIAASYEGKERGRAGLHLAWNPVRGRTVQ
jgi:hypothetical protein